MANSALTIEERLAELEARLAHATDEAERSHLRQELDREREQALAQLTPWQRVELARHAQRPRMLDYTGRILEDFVELHGDRCSGEDPAMVTGIGQFQGRTIVVVGQQKGVSTEEKIQRKFGMAHPQGYRKALRMFQMAERLRLPIVTLVDTPAAHPDPVAEQHGQGPAIAQDILALMGIKTPVFCAVLGEGGSGGALAIAVGDWVAMFENAIYVVCPPERCAEILWRDGARKELAAGAMKVTARDLKEVGVIDVVLPEPDGGAHKNPGAAARVLADELARFLEAANRGEWTSMRRQEKFRRMGIWHEQI